MTGLALLAPQAVPPWEGTEGFPAFSLPDLFVPASEVLALLSAEEEVSVCVTELWSAVLDLMRDDFLSGCPQLAAQCVISPPPPFMGLRGASIAMPAAVQQLAALPAGAAALPGGRCWESSCPHWTGVASCAMQRG